MEDYLKKYGSFPEAFNVVDKQNKNAIALLLGNSSDFDERIVSMLLDAGINVNCPDHTGATPFMRAAQHGHNRAIELMLENKKCPVNVNAADEDGHTALMCAIMGGIDTVQCLLNNANGLDFGLRNREGVTAAEMAKNNRREHIALLITEKELDLKERRKEEKIENRHQEVMGRLKELENRLAKIEGYLAVLIKKPMAGEMASPAPSPTRRPYFLEEISQPARNAVKENDDVDERKKYMSSSPH